MNLTEDGTIQEVSPITAFFTNQTCGEACWHAKEDVCRCYCGGRNHGCLKTPDGIKPTRMAKIDGFMYQLKGFGSFNELYADAKRENSTDYALRIAPKMASGTPYGWRETDAGAPARIKPPTYQQTQKWDEFKQFHGLDKRGIFQKNGYRQLYALWIRIN